MHNRSAEQRTAACLKTVATKRNLGILFGAANPTTVKKILDARHKNGTDKCPYRSENAKKGWIKRHREGNDKHTPDVTKLCLRRHPMSSLEITMLGIIQKHNLPYKFCGNGDFMIENKCPDFVNTNGEKKVIEVYGTGHKNMFRNGGVAGWKQQRTELFLKHGYETIFFNEREVHVEEFVLQRLQVST